MPITLPEKLFRKWLKGDVHYHPQGRDQPGCSGPLVAKSARDSANSVIKVKPDRGKLDKQVMEGAVAQFEHCIRRDMLFIPAWEGMAVAYRQMGKKKEANRCEEMAAHIRKHLWEKEESPKKS